MKILTLLSLVVTLMLIVHLSACGYSPSDNEVREARTLKHTGHGIHPESILVHDEGSIEGLDIHDRAQRMAEAVASMTGVHGTEVLISKDKAFVAVKLHDRHGGVSRYMKGAISDKIKSMDRSIRKVLITDQPELMRSLEEIRAGMKDGNETDVQIQQLSTSFR